jgi:hypothetical protein
MKQEILIQKVRQALKEIDEALECGEFSVAREGYPTAEELKDIRGQVEQLELELAESRIRPKNERSLWIGRVITDGWWQYKSPLVDTLLEMSDAYLRKLP